MDPSAIINIHEITPMGWAFLFGVFYIVSVYVEFVILRLLFSSALKKYTETLYEQYRESLEAFKRQHRI